jgi:hypothetical protein
MKILKATLLERLRHSLAPAHAVTVIATLQRTRHPGHVDYLAVKEASEMVERYKLEARIAIRQWRSWQNRHSKANVGTERRGAGSASRQAEGRLILQSARSATALYLDARHSFQELVSFALMTIAQVPANRR